MTKVYPPGLHECLTCTCHQRTWRGNTKPAIPNEIKNTEPHRAYLPKQEIFQDKGFQFSPEVSPSRKLSLFFLLESDSVTCYSKEHGARLPAKEASESVGVGGMEVKWLFLYLICARTRIRACNGYGVYKLQLFVLIFYKNELEKKIGIEIIWTI